jgi:Na+-translocating ferredoxin:NAD+ oxidoreductase RnfC subunit
VLGVAKFDNVGKYIGTQEDFTRVEILLRQHIGAPSIPCVKDGDKVQKGDVIAQAAEGLSLPQHASVSGTVSVYNDRIIIEKDNV